MLLDDPQRVKRLLFACLRIDFVFSLILVYILFSIGTSSFNISIPYKDLLLGICLGSCIALITITIGKYTKLFKIEKNYKTMIFIITVVIILFIYINRQEIVLPFSILVGYYNALVVFFLIILAIRFNWSNE